jgi:hypothetical protein
MITADIEIGFGFRLQKSLPIFITCFKDKISIQLCRGSELSKVYLLIESLEVLCKAIRTSPDEDGFILSKTSFGFFRHKISKETFQSHSNVLEPERYTLGISAALCHEPL